MDPPAATEVETKSEKIDEIKGHDCGLCDTEVVYKIAQELLPGLASACIDNTTGGIFKNAGSVVVDMRKQMAVYLTKRSEVYVVEFLLTDNASGLDVSEHPYDIIVSLIDDFASSKTNMFSRVSEWVLSDRREDRIDDFVQEMEINGFWLLPQRENVASVLLKNVDYKNVFHCNVVCNCEKEVNEHRLECKFRPMDCTNEGCTTRYCAVQKEHHEAVCPFMVLPCEQKCLDYVMRREMDRHCVTICPMKLVNCAFYTVGCESSIPRCNVQQHNTDSLSSHLLYIIRTAHKDATDEDLKHRVEQIRNQSNTEKLAKARDARALTYLIKDAEAKLGPLEVKTKPNAGELTEPLRHEVSNKKDPPTNTGPSSTKLVDSPTKIEPSSTRKPNSPTKIDPSSIGQLDSPTKIGSSSTKQPDSTTKTQPSPTKTKSSPIKQPDLTVQSEPSSTKQPDSPKKTKPLSTKQLDSPRKTEPSSTTQADSPKNTMPLSTKQPDLPKKLESSSTGQPDSTTKPRPSSTKQPDSPTKLEPSSIVSQPVDETRSLTERSSITKDDTTSPTEEVHPESTIMKEGFVDPTVNIEEFKDKKDRPSSSSSSMEEKQKHSESPVKTNTKQLTTKEEEKQGTIDDNKKEDTIRPPNAVGEDSIKSFRKKTVSEPSNNNEEEKSKQLSDNDKEDTKKIETIQESS